MVKRNAAEAEAACYYALGYASLRAGLRDAMPGWSVEEMAAEMMVPVRQLQGFMDGLDATVRVWKAGVRVTLALDPEKREFDIEDVALNLVSDTFPKSERVRARRVLREALYAALESLRHKAPTD